MKAFLEASLVVVLCLAGCGRGDTDRQGAGGSQRKVAGPRDADTRLKLTVVAQAQSPVALAFRQNDATLYIAEKGGRIVALHDGAVDETPVLDLTTKVSHGSEQGLLGLAFAPDGAQLFVNYTDTAGDTRVVAYGMDGNRADVGSARELLHVKQPYANHNGGNLVVGPDGMLWIGLGDGGSGGDPKGNGQNLTVLLGKMLRIDPTPTATAPYTVPPSNPFVGRTDARPEIWAYGLRNPWRYTFDRVTGELWIADVGQNKWEEINVVPLGGDGDRNFGWARMEGTHGFKGAALAKSVLPVHEYSHDNGACSVTGGYVYRGKRIPSLVGTYLFADFCVGKVQGLRLRKDAPARIADLGIAVPALGSFGEDSEGELYVLSLAGTVSRVDPATSP